MNPRDDTAFSRIIDFFPLGVGPKTMAQLQKISKETRESLFATFKKHFRKKFDDRGIFKKIELLNKNKNTIPISEILRQLIEVSHFISILEEKKEHDRLLNIQELITFIENWERNNPQAEFFDLLDRMSLEPRGNDQEKRAPVYLLTMHNAKGTEFPTVIVSGINATYMPFFLRKGFTEIEEERRLFYVSATRAIRLLVVSTGSHKPSRFLFNIRPDLYNTVYSSEELFDLLLPTEDEPPGKEGEQFLQHPVFGKGKIIKEVNRHTYLIQFKEKGDILIDTSVVKVNFL
jgi:superfamily I DNA/RNA helicase